MWQAFLAALFLLQASTTPRASLEGRVVRLGSAEPITRARVVLAKVSGQLGDYRTSSSAEGGAFAFRDLEAGTYRLYADHDGYLPTEYGQRIAGSSLNPLNPTGVPIAVSAGQQLKDVVITMIPPSSITGRIVDNNREPLRHVWVRALRALYRDGQRTLSIVDYAESNDLGEYRLFGLTAGFYFVSAIPQERPRTEGDRYVVPVIPSNANNNQSVIRTEGGRALAAGSIAPAAFARDTYLTTYYPGTTDPALATSVNVQPGATGLGIDFSLSSVPTVRIRGNVINGATGQLAQSASISLGPVAQPGAGVTTSTQANGGSFELSGIPAGDYYVSGTGGGPAQRLFGRLPISVADRDLENLTVVLQPGKTLMGRIVIEGGISASTQGGPRVALNLNPGYSLPPPGPEGRFVVRDVRDGDYTLRLVAPPNAFIKEARFGSSNALDGIHIEGDLRGQQLEIVVSYSTGMVEALVVDEKQRPVAGAVVVAIPDAARRNRSDLYRSATTDASGRVRFQGIWPGDYKLFAADRIDAPSWQDPSVIRLYESRGEPIHLNEGGSATAVVKLIPSQQ